MFYFIFFSVQNISQFPFYLTSIGYLGMCYFQIFRDFPNNFLSLISNSIPMCVYSMLCMIWILLNFLRLVLWLRMWCLLVKVPCVLEMNVYSAATGWNVLQKPARSSAWQLFKCSVFLFSVYCLSVTEDCWKLQFLDFFYFSLQFYQFLLNIVWISVISV